MEGAPISNVLFYDDVPGQQAPGLANVLLDDDEPLPFDVLLGHRFVHAAPNQVGSIVRAVMDPLLNSVAVQADAQLDFTPPLDAPAPELVQDDVAFGVLEAAPVQHIPGNGHQLGMIDLEHGQPGGVPNHLPVRWYMMSLNVRC